MWLSSLPPGNSHTFTQLSHGSLPASSQDKFFLPSYQLKRFSQEGEEREKLSGHPKHYHIQNDKAQAQICVQRALCQMLPNWKKKFYRGTASNVTRHSVWHLHSVRVGDSCSGQDVSGWLPTQLECTITRLRRLLYPWVLRVVLFMPFIEIWTTRMTILSLLLLFSFFQRNIPN